MLEGPDYISPGVVQFFDHAAVAFHPQVWATTPAPWHVAASVARPFLCVEVTGRSAVWASVGDIGRPERLPLPPEWRIGGSRAWRGPGTMYLQDAADLYIAPLPVWVDLSVVDRSNEHTVGILLPEGMEAVTRAIRRSKHRRIAPRHLTPATVSR
jgi:hypothetical protein